MMPRRFLAVALLLLTASVCRSLSGRAPSGVLSDPASAGALDIHQRLVARLATPDIAVTLVGAGILLLFVECNLPGAVLPGAAGLLLLLSGLYGLSLQPLRASSIVVLLLAGLALALSPRLPLAGITAVFGVMALIDGLGTLIPATPTHSGVHASVAILTGAAVGLSATLLGRIADRARRNKAICSSGAET